MIFLFPILALLPSLVYLAAALLPAALLLRYVYKTDTIEPEPPSLLAKLLVGGCLAALCAGFLEGLAEYFLRLVIRPDSPIYVILLAFLVVAVAEEGMKLFFLRRFSWNHPAFNYRFDGIVYAVFVSLGFAALENVQYVVNYGLSVALPRALLAIPGHMSFSVFMGMYYGRARVAAYRGDDDAAAKCLRRGWLIAVLLHGFYDSCAMTGTGLASFLFLVFVILMFASAYRTLKLEAAADRPITPY